MADWERTRQPGWQRDATGTLRWWTGRSWGQPFPFVQVAPTVPFSEMAVISLIAGLVAVLLAWLVIVAWFPAIVGLALGISGLRDTRTRRRRGGRLAGAGVILSSLSLAWCLLSLAAAMVPRLG